MQNGHFSEVRDKIKKKIKNIVEDHQVPQLDSAVLKDLEKWEEKLGLSIK